MSGSINKIQNGAMIGFILCIVFGIIICIWPGTVLLTICRIAGFIILLFGIFRLLSCIKDPCMVHKGFPMFVGILLCVIGIWILSAPGTFLKLIPIVIGVLLIYHGVRNIYLSIKFKNGNGSHWGLSLFLGVLSVIFGIVLIRCAFLALEIGMVILGIALIYTGISGLFVNYRTGGGRKDRVIDVDYREE